MKTEVNRLEITTRVGCGVMCKACPQTLFVKRYKELFPSDDIILSSETFKKCLENIPKDTHIDWSGFSEPFLNPLTIEMIQYADLVGFKQTLFTTLIRLDKYKWNLIKDIDFEEIIIHIPDAEHRADFNVDLDLLKYVSKTKIRAYHCHGTPRGDLYPYLGEYPIWNELHNRGGNISENFVAKRYVEEFVQCLYTRDKLNHNVLLPNGFITLCCMDFGLENILGNLTEKTWRELHNYLSDNNIGKIRAKMNSREDCLCNYCFRGIKC